MLGLSLNPRVFSDDKATDCEQLLLSSFGGITGLLKHVRELGVTHIELRTVKADADAAFVLHMANTIWDSGLKLTVHGALPKDESRGFSACYTSVLPLLERLPHYQDGLTITLHSYSDKEGDVSAFAADTTHVLNEWCKSASALPIRFALEINRKKGRMDPSVTCDGVLSMLAGVQQSNSGVCWDFGHYYYNMSAMDNTPDLLPPKAFLKRAIHTHIHAVGPLGTHTPFVPGAFVPLAKYVGALMQNGYQGVYNFEPTFERFPEGAVAEALDDSIRLLANTLEKGGAKL